MAITGTWKDRASVQAGARKWGTGVNPIHSINDTHGRMISAHGNTATVDESLTQVEDYDSDGWTNAQWQDEYHESDRDIGMYDRPNYGDNPQNVRSDVRFPQWGPYGQGIPGGTAVRSEKHGADDRQTSNQNPTETVSEGWLNKEHLQQPEDSVTADISQVLMQTSMTQRDKQREGSQRGDGSASEYTAPIRDYMPGMRVRHWSGGHRHEDMAPRQQTQRIRPFWNRNAGTGSPGLLQANAQQSRHPIRREPPADPSLGGSPGVIDSTNYGYVAEDVIPYA